MRSKCWHLGLIKQHQINLSTKHIKQVFLIITFAIGFFKISYTQCITSGSISVSTSGFESGAGFSQAYVLVDDVTDEILVINSTGVFTSLTNQPYRIYAVNYDGATPSELIVGDLWADLASNTSSYCMNIIGPYDCPELICEGDNLVTTASGYTTGGSFVEKYVIVNSSGNIVSTNTTGTFTSLAVGEYSVYAINTDDASLKADIEDLGSWSDIAGSVACSQILGPKNIICEPCSYLPITLIDFNGELNSHKNVNLYWKTATEINNDFFTVERSKDGYEFFPILYKKGAGNSSNIINYSDIDYDPIKGISYYRLKQTDFDGNYSYSNIISISNTENSFKIYPNPSKDGYFTIDDIKNANQIKITDPLGRILKTYTNLNTNTLRLNLSNYTKGFYYVLIATQNNLVTEKIIIQ